MTVHRPGEDGVGFLEELAESNCTDDRTTLEFVSDLDVSPDKKKRLLKSVYVDGRTGLYNQSYFEDIPDYQNAKNNTMVAMLDLDEFKRLNDTYGHPVGDRILEEFGRVLREETTGQQTPVRYGGEEFLIMQDGRDQDAFESLRSTLESVRKRLDENPVFSVNEEEQTPYQTSFSAGVASTAESVEFGQCVDLADQQLYVAKENGRDQTRFDQFSIERSTGLSPEQIQASDSTAPTVSPSL